MQYKWHCDEFSVDTSEAGEGDLKVTVTHNYQQVPAYITHQRAGLYRVDFTPEGAGTYKVNVFYSDIEVRGRNLFFMIDFILIWMWYLSWLDFN